MYDLIKSLSIRQLRSVQDNRYDTFLKTVGKKVREVRTSQGLSMETLANEANIEYRQLGRIERGEVNTTITSLLKIADVLKVEVSVFFQP